MKIYTVRELIEALKELPSEMKMLEPCIVRTPLVNGVNKECLIDHDF